MSFDFEIVLRTVTEHDVEFGVAAAIHGAPIMTQDLDILYRIEPSNLERLKTALDALDPVVRDDPRRLRFDISHLEGKRSQVDDDASWCARRARVDRRRAHVRGSLSRR